MGIGELEDHASSIDEVAQNEMKAIARMLRIATKNQLETEVVYAFAYNMKSGLSVSQSAAAALYEWDC